MLVLTEEEFFLQSIMAKNDVAITDIQLRKLTEYKIELLNWNKKINLISRKDEAAIFRTHILLSLSVLSKFSFLEGMHILDLGTGGGLPGIPLAILTPRAHFTLLDSIGKKITAVSEIVKRLGLLNVKAVCGRAEELGGRESYKHSFDAVIVRSVSNLKTVVTWALPFLTSAGHRVELNLERRTDLNSPAILCWKGGEIMREVVDAKSLYPEILVSVIDLFPTDTDLTGLVEKKLLIVQQ